MKLPILKLKNQMIYCSFGAGEVRPYATNVALSVVIVAAYFVNCSAMAAFKPFFSILYACSRQWYTASALLLP